MTLETLRTRRHDTRGMAPLLSRAPRDVRVYTDTRYTDTNTHVDRHTPSASPETPTETEMQECCPRASTIGLPVVGDVSTTWSMRQPLRVRSRNALPWVSFHTRGRRHGHKHGQGRGQGHGDRNRRGRGHSYNRGFIVRARPSGYDLMGRFVRWHGQR